MSATYKINQTARDLVLEVHRGTRDLDESGRGEVSFGSTALRLMGFETMCEGINKTVCGLWKHLLDQRRRIQHPIYVKPLIKTVECDGQSFTYASNSTPEELIDMIEDLCELYL